MQEPKTFLANNDINITASCTDIDFTSGSMKLFIHALPCFWTFLFQDHDLRKIQPVNTINMDEYGVNTCVRIAYKAFQIEEYDVSFSLGNISFTKGTITASGKEKFDQMKNWPESPFHEYQCKKEGNHFVLAKKYEKVSCATDGCLRWANKNCGHKMCKKCCMEVQKKSLKNLLAPQRIIEVHGTCANIEL